MKNEVFSKESLAKLVLSMPNDVLFEVSENHLTVRNGNSYKLQIDSTTYAESVGGNGYKFR